MNIKSVAQYILSCLLAIVFYSCNSALPEAIGYDNDKEQTCKMILAADCPTFIDEFGTRAENGRWEEGDKVYIHISSTIYGVGTYQNGDWMFTYDGKLSNMNSAPCSLYYIKGNCESSNNKLFSMDEKSAIYGTTSGVYSYLAGELTISATLRPLTSRMRFKGTANTQFVFKASNTLKHYQQLDIAKNQLTTETKDISLTVNADGYTDYIYVMAEEDVSISLSFKTTIYSNKQLSKSLFSAGASGYIEIPSSDSFDGWIKKDAPKAIIKESFIDQISNSIIGGDRSLIHTINFDYNSSVSSGEVVSRSNSGLPIYANFNNGILTISTPASEITAMNMGEMFSGCENLTALDLSGFNTQNVTDMSYMLANGRNLTTLDLTGFSTQNVTDMRVMFSGCENLSALDLSGFNTQNVIDMTDMFTGCASLTSLDLSGFNTQNVTDMYGMFWGCTNLTALDLSGFNTQNVTDMNRMFCHCENLASLDLSGFNTQNVADMSRMFWSCKNLASLDLSGFNTQNVTIMENMFSGCENLSALDLSRFNTQNVTDMSGMFSYCTSLTSLDLSRFDTQNVTHMGWMFSDCDKLTSLNLSGFNTQNVTNMRVMFSRCTNLTSLDLSGFNTQNVRDMGGMFSYCYYLSSLDLSGFDIQNETEMRDMFFYCENLNAISCSLSTKLAIEAETTSLKAFNITWNITD